MESKGNAMLRQKTKHKKFYILLSILLACCFVEYVFGLYIPQAVYLAIAFLMALSGDADEIAALCMSCVPLHTYLEFSFIVLFGMICHVVKNGDGIRLKRCILPVALMLVWELLHCFIPSLNLMQFGGLCVPWIMLAIFMCSWKHRYDYGFVVRSFVLSSVVMCCSLVGRLVYHAGGNLSMAFVNMQRLGVEIADSRVKINPNTLGILCLFGISGLLQLRMAGRGQRQDLPFMILMLLFGVMTASKTFFVCLVFAALLFLFATKGSVRQKLRYLVNVALIGLAVLTISSIVMPDVLRYYVSRFFEADFTTGRIDTMAKYHNYMMKHWNVLFFGIGLQDFSIRVVQMCPEAIFVPHNAVQELVLAWGLPGITLFIGLWSCMIVQARKHNRHIKLLNWIPFLVWLLKNMAGQMLNSPYTMLLLGFIYLSMCTDFTYQDEAEKDTQYPILEEEGIDLHRAIKALWRKKYILAAVSMTVAVLAFGVTKTFVTPVYESAALIYVNNSNIAAERVVDVITNGDIAASRSLVNTYRTILQSRQTINDVISSSGIQGTYEEVLEMISADAADGTEILKVVVKHPDPLQAMSLANAVADVLPQRITEIIEGTSATVIDYAVAAQEPTSPSKANNTVVAFAIAFVVTAMLVLWSAMQAKKLDNHDLTKMFQYPVLAAIPDVNVRKARRQRRRYSNAKLGGNNVYKR